MMKILFLVLVLLSTELRAEAEIYTLRHRTVEQVLPVLRPLVEAGGAQGSGVVSTVDVHREEIRRVWVKVDELR